MSGDLARALREFGKAQGADYTVHKLPGGGEDGSTLKAGRR